MLHILLKVVRCDLFPSTLDHSLGWVRWHIYCHCSYSSRLFDLSPDLHIIAVGPVEQVYWYGHYLAAVRSVIAVVLSDRRVT
jgi:hypothetical protein